MLQKECVMRARPERSNPVEEGATTEAAINLSSIIGLGAMGDFRAALTAMNPDTNVSRPTTTVSDFNGNARELRHEDGSRVRTYELGGRAEWDRQNRVTRMTDRTGNSFQLTYEGNATQPSRIQGSNGLDFRPDGQARVVVNHQVGMIEMTHENGLGATYFLNGTSTEITDGSKGRYTTQRFFNPGDGSLTTSVEREGSIYSEQTVTRRDGSGSRVLLYPRGQGGAGQPDMVPISAQFAPGQANPTYTTMQNGQQTRHDIRNVREISYSDGSMPGLSNLQITTHDGRSFYVSDVGAGGNARSVLDGNAMRFKK